MCVRAFIVRCIVTDLPPPPLTALAPATGAPATVAVGAAVFPGFAQSAIVDSFEGKSGFDYRVCVCFPRWFVRWTVGRFVLLGGAVSCCFLSSRGVSCCRGRPLRRASRAPLNPAERNVLSCLAAVNAGCAKKFPSVLSICESVCLIGMEWNDTDKSIERNKLCLAQSQSRLGQDLVENDQLKGSN